MAYEFTKQKIRRERKAFVKRIVVSVASGATGFALGVFMYDMESFWGILSTSVLTTIAGFGAFYAVGITQDKK